MIDWRGRIADAAQCRQRVYARGPGGAIGPGSAEQRFPDDASPRLHRVRDRDFLELQRHPTPIRSVFLTIFRPSFGIAAAAICRLKRGTDRVASNKPSMVLAENAVCKGSGNADEQRHGWSSWWGGASRWSPGRSGCVPAHPAYWRASASYRPLRAVWALRAWALRGTRDRQEPLSAWNDSASAKGTLQ
jgi:hypothetical protein